MQRIPLFCTSRFHDGFGITVGMVNLLRDGLTGTDAVQVIAVGNVGALILLPAACAIQLPSAK